MLRAGGGRRAGADSRHRRPGRRRRPPAGRPTPGRCRRRPSPTRPTCRRRSAAARSRSGPCPCSPSCRCGPSCTPWPCGRRRRSSSGPWPSGEEVFTASARRATARRRGRRRLPVRQRRGAATFPKLEEQVAFVPAGSQVFAGSALRRPEPRRAARTSAWRAQRQRDAGLRRRSSPRPSSSAWCATSATRSSGGDQTGDEFLPSGAPRTPRSSWRPRTPGDGADSPRYHRAGTDRDAPLRGAGRRWWSGRGGHRLLAGAARPRRARRGEEDVPAREDLR